ncbi:MAG: VOC family protein [bacterium]
MQKITPFLWFDNQAGEAARFYATVFKGSRIKSTTTLSETPSGKVELVTMEILGQEFTLMSAGPHFKINEAISFVVNCETQDEVDYYWEQLSADPKAEQCGWLKDKFGVSWQIVPTAVGELLQEKDPAKSRRVMDAVLKMKKIDIATLKRARDQG